jgi:hypothetical protein
MIALEVSGNQSLEPGPRLRGLRLLSEQGINFGVRKYNISQTNQYLVVTALN